MSQINYFNYDDEISRFWLMNYDLNYFPIFSLPLLRSNTKTCPGYLPYVKKGLCRVCGNNSKNHRKYYIYSNFVRKIQRLAIKYIYKKFINRNLHVLNNSVTPFVILYYKLFYKYYRKWNNIFLGNNFDIK